MGLYRQLPDDIQTVDVIVAGGGTAGCVVAARLAEADPDLSVLIVEAGSDGAGNPAVDYPAFFLTNLLPSATTTALYKSKLSNNLGGREIVVPAGAVLGGGSSINMMMYSRAQRDDWDSWRTPGWTADEMLPYLKKLETYHGPGSMDRHGSSGPIYVSSGTFTGKRCQDDFISAMNKVGWPEIEDLGSLDACNGVQRAVRFISPDGKRQDTASRYLKPLLQDGARPNLHVLVESQVVRVLFQGKRASGIVYQSKAGDTPDRTVNASKMVIVSAGAFGTPAILERSGIGNYDIIRRAGIEKVVADVPGVGHEYDDHHLLVYPYKSSLNPDETMDGILSGNLNPAELIQNNDKILGWNAQDVTCKLRPTDKDVASLGPAFKEVWDEEFGSSPNKPLMMMSLINGFPGEPIGIPPGQYFGVSTFTTYPFSRGHVHITGPKSPTFPRNFQSRMYIEYSAEDDAIIDKWARDNVSSAWHSSGTCKMAPRDQNGVVDQYLSVYGVEGLKVADLSIMPKNVAANTNNTAIAIGEKAASIFIKELGLNQRNT
ncbi:alcohol oxidase [Hypoxylon sp. FL1857]|nr:alcohol oxidase [Hypoxylon sp. FL1857]